GEMVEYAELVVTTVQNQAVDVAFAIAIPSSPKANPPGAGGGWLDGTPFPFSGGTFSAVTAVLSTTRFTVASTDAGPVVGDTVCWLSRDDWTMRTGKITSIPGSSNPYEIIIDTPFVSVNGV